MGWASDAEFVGAQIKVEDPCARKDPPEEVCVAESNQAQRSGVIGAVCSVTVPSGQKVQ